MKRSVLHFIFWFVYLVQDIFLHFTWMAPAIKNVPEAEQFWMAIQTTFAVLPPKLFIVYYFINRGIKKLSTTRNDWPRQLPEFFFMIAFSVALFRVTFHYVVYPGIYSLPVNVPVFDARNVLIAVLEMGYVTGIAITLKLLRIQASAREREQNLVREKLQTELKFLRNQINPHFLFNTLNNIYALTRKKSDNAPEAVMVLSELLSFMLYESGKDSIPIEKEMKILEDYMELEKMRYNKRLSVQFTKEIDNPSQPIAPLLFLPLVENAFKHGISETRFNSSIAITMKLSQRDLAFSIENTIPNGKMKNGNGSIGLSNIRRQLELMYKEHQIDVQTLNNTFRINITINLDSYGKV